MEEQYKPLFTALQSTIRAAAGVAAQDISFNRRLEKKLDESATKQSERLLDLANKIIQHVNKGEVDDIEVDGVDDDLTDSWPEINTTLNALTYKIEDSLHQHRKLLKKGDTDANSEEKETGPKQEQIKLSDNSRSTGNETVNKHQFDLPKPQNKFRNPINNKKTIPFKPHITSKPNATVPFEESVKIVEPDEDNVLERPHYLQPYESEILSSKYPKSVYTKHEPIPSLPWATTTPIWVDTPDKLDAMISQISDAPELALDLEHHGYRSYLGITCLLQLSDRKNDFIIDTLALRDDLQPLNKIFTNPDVVKVLHGASMDIIWLQRDLGLYIVSLFDTFFASKALNLKRNGLAYLLETYANFQTSKKYQLADWRVRPIPAEMLSYAQSDTHFLLNIYDQIKNQVLDNNHMEFVLENSRKTAAQRFEMPGYDDGHYFKNPFGDLPVKDLAKKNHLTKSQMVYLELFYEWRDSKAREIDESPSFVMPVHVMITLSKEMPTKTIDVIKKAGPHGNRLREYTNELKSVIKAAQKAVESIDNGEELAGVEQWDSKTMSQSYESILENYDSYEMSYRQAVQAQQGIFDAQTLEKASSQYTKDSSLFYGVTMQHIEDPETVALLFPIEHLPEGLPLYTGEAADNKSHEASQPKKDESKQKEKEEDEDFVYIGNSNNTGELSTIEEAVKDKGKEASSSDTIMLPTAAELLGSKINVLTKNERKKLKREKRLLEEKKRKEAEGIVDEPEEEDNEEAHGKPGKKQKKGKKRAAEQQEGEEGQKTKIQKTGEDTSGDDTKEGFDYKSAPSVLYGDVEGTGRKSKKNKKQKDFNPYNVLSTTLEGASKKDIATKTTTNSSVSYKVQKSKKKRS